LTIGEARVALAALEPSLAKNGDGGTAITVDASALTAFDTSAIAVLLELRRQAQALGRTLAVHGAPAAMVELAGLYGVAELLGFGAPA
jgi:phospholipid transport system transporter-binding protein